MTMLEQYEFDLREQCGSCGDYMEHIEKTRMGFHIWQCKDCQRMRSKHETELEGGGAVDG